MPEKEYPGTLGKSKLFPENQMKMEHSALKDNSRKYRIKQNNDYPANKPCFHAVFQDAAQPPLHKRFSTRVVGGFPHVATTSYRLWRDIVPGPHL